MSMISAQIDELRQMADGKATFHDAREVMLEAADTIWQLRDDLQRANAAVQDAEHDESMAWDRVRKAEAENAKLRVERDEWHRVAVSKQDIIDHMRNANSENAKLRELAKGLSWCSEERYLGHQESECPLYDERTDGKCRAEALMKELGIEVDDGTK